LAVRSRGLVERFGEVTAGGRWARGPHAPHVGRARGARAARCETR